MDYGSRNGKAKRKKYISTTKLKRHYNPGIDMGYVTIKFISNGHEKNLKFNCKKWTGQDKLFFTSCLCFGLLTSKIGFNLPAVSALDSKSFTALVRSQLGKNNAFTIGVVEIAEVCVELQQNIPFSTVQLIVKHAYKQMSAFSKTEKGTPLLSDEEKVAACQCIKNQWPGFFIDPISLNSTQSNKQQQQQQQQKQK